ncbi:archaeal proteasome endopeptidase complex subunit alpha [Candidatus Woesearchaeota archaeon]|nr:archaeal proteasome endopeptidase complex subunit alpha [Candidatus Woesearchaeota archaeon]
MAKNDDSLQNQMMGYDRAITLFSPDGRLLQVEYAEKTVRKGSPAIGMVCKDGILLVTDKRIIDKLVVAEKLEKIWEIDEHIAVTAAGILSDARILIERAQLKAQQHRITYDSPIDIKDIIKHIADIKQMCTQYGGLRPFGVSLLIAGIDQDGPKLFETNPTGIFFEYYATAIGENSKRLKEILSKKYRPDLTIEKGLKIALDALKSVTKEKLSAGRIGTAYITKEEKKLKSFSDEKIEKML